MNEECMEKSLDEAQLTETFGYDLSKLYKALIESTDDYIYIGDMKTGTFRYPPAMIKEFELPGEVVPDAAQVMADIVHPNDRELFFRANKEIADGACVMHNVEYRAKNREGQWIWLRCRGYLNRDEQGEPELFAGFITNLGKKNRIDHLTGLYNKFQLQEDVKQLILCSPTQPFGMMMLDIDDFKHINDLYDRWFGDEVIHDTAQKILSILPSKSSVYRMDGDEFCILIRNVKSSDFNDTYEEIHKIFAHQQEYDGKKYTCSISGGASSYPINGVDYLSLLKYANYALEYAKKSGKHSMRVFQDEILMNKERTLELTEMLREDIEHGFQNFELHYQPVVYADSGQIMGAEALVRWQCGKYGKIPPMEFIPVLEQNNLIIPTGKWIFREAVKQCKEWCKFNPDFKVSINLSYLQIIEEDFAEFVKEAIEREGVPFHNLVLELTETYMIKEKEHVNEIFRRVQEMGVRVAMDDFGTGYSSLGVLKDTPVDIVKIDRTFVEGMQKDAFDMTFIYFIIQLCHNVGKEVCLEGVELEEEYEIVKASGMEYIQGYFFGRPMEAAQFTKILEEESLKR